MVSPRGSLERRELMGYYIRPFNARVVPIDWDFINKDLYGDFIYCELSSNSGSSSSSPGLIEITM